MENFKGTKGKWTRYTASVPSLDRPTKHSVYTGCKRIALCYNLFENDKTLNVDEQESEYNAQLIAHAPEMLEKLSLCKVMFSKGKRLTTTDMAIMVGEIKDILTRATTI